MTEKMTYPEYTIHYPLLVKNFMKRPLYLYPDDDAMVYRNDAGEYFENEMRQRGVVRPVAAILLRAAVVARGIHCHREFGRLAGRHHDAVAMAGLPATSIRFRDQNQSPRSGVSNEEGGLQDRPLRHAPEVALAARQDELWLRARGVAACRPRGHPGREKAKRHQ